MVVELLICLYDLINNNVPVKHQPEIHSNNLVKKKKQKNGFS
jgi:hypothetical protein